MSVTIESNNLDIHNFSSPHGRHIFRENDGSGDLWIIYTRQGNVYLRKSVDNGSTWESPIIGYSATGSSDYAVESTFVYYSGGSTIFAVYHTRPDERLYSRSFDITTETWNADQTELVAPNTPIWNVVVERDNSGRLWVGYVKYKFYSTATETCTYYIRRSTNINDITAWGADVNLGNSGAFDGYAQLRINTHGITDDKVLATYFKYIAGTTYTVYSRLNDGLGDGAGNWAAEVQITTTVYGTTLNDGTSETHFSNFRRNPYFWTVKLADGTIYILTAVPSNIYIKLFDWGTGNWTAKTTGTAASSLGYLCGCYGSTTTVRSFVGISGSIQYIDYSIAGNSWGSLTLIESGNGYCMTCTDGFTVLNENRLLYQTIVTNYALPA